MLIHTQVNKRILKKNPEKQWCVCLGVIEPGAQHIVSTLTFTSHRPAVMFGGVMHAALMDCVLWSRGQTQAGL